MDQPGERVRLSLARLARPSGLTRMLRNRWGSVEQRGRGFVYPECLDGGQNLLLVASKGHAHSEQVSMETESLASAKNRNHVW